MFPSVIKARRYVYRSSLHAPDLNSEDRAYVIKKAIVACRDTGISVLVQSKLSRVHLAAFLAPPENSF
jgi:hypothetical protein